VFGAMANLPGDGVRPGGVGWPPVKNAEASPQDPYPLEMDRLTAEILGGQPQISERLLTIPPSLRASLGEICLTFAFKRVASRGQIEFSLGKEIGQPMTTGL
jgi:hypothetical protein